MYLVPAIAQNLYVQKILPQNLTSLQLQLNASFEILIIYHGLPELNVSINISSSYFNSTYYFQTINPFRIRTTTTNSMYDFPIFVVTRQEHAVSSWPLPMMIETTMRTDIPFNRVSKIMCHDYLDKIIANGLFCASYYYLYYEYMLML